MMKKKFKVWHWLMALALGLLTTTTSGCIWYGRRGRAHLFLPVDGAVVIDGGGRDGGGGGRDGYRR
jgi:hypothetical protein